MEINIAQIGIDFALRIPFEFLKTSAISCDWRKLNRNGVIDPQGRRRGYDASALKTPAERLGELERAEHIGSNLCFTQTYRNCYQHLRCPLYSSVNGLCQSELEEMSASKRPYYGLAHYEYGFLKPIAIDADNVSILSEDCLYWAAGVPVLWEGNVSGFEELAPTVYDPRHLFRITRREDFESARSCIIQYRHATKQTATEAIGLATAGIERHPPYLHNAIGCCADAMYIIVAYGTLPEIGIKARDLGATHCVVMDNGGSCQIGIRRSDEQMQPIVQSHYFREPTIVLAAYESSYDGNHVPIRKLV